MTTFYFHCANCKAILHMPAHYSRTTDSIPIKCNVCGFNGVYDSGDLCNTDDYTHMPLGAKIHRGEIKVCPTCKRLGLCKEINGLTFFTHSQWINKGANDVLESGEDSCPPQPLPNT